MTPYDLELERCTANLAILRSWEPQWLKVHAIVGGREIMVAPVDRQAFIDFMIGLEEQRRERIVERLKERA